MRLTSNKRWLAALVALSYLVGYLLVFAHFAGEQHGTCAEHGEAHHVEDAGEASAPVAGLNALPGVEDDHCSLLYAVRKPLATKVAVVVALHDVPPRIDITPARLNLPPPHHGAIWRYAPKQSPPAHA